MNSYHIFYFPFIRKGNDTAIVKDNLRHNRFWKHTSRYDEDINIVRQYYHYFVCNAFYDNGNEQVSLIDSPKTKKEQINDDNNLVYHFVRKDSDDASLEITYTDPNTNELKEYVLRIEKITLDYYFTGVGILSLYVANDSYSAEQDILNINYFGRIVYNCFIAVQHNLLLSIRGLRNDRYEQRFTESVAVHELHDKACLDLANHIKRLLDDFYCQSDKTSTGYIPIFSDKMYVNCSYDNEGFSEYIKGKDLDKLSNNLFWVNYFEIDNGPYYGCQDMEMRRRITTESTYTRWLDSGTLYGITNKSFVCVYHGADFIPEHMKIIYSHMIKLVLVQLASLLKFSNALNEINADVSIDNKTTSVGKIYGNYILYMRKFYFREITSQIQGIDFYTLLQKSFNINEYIEKLNESLSRMNVYISAIKELKNQEYQNSIFNWAAAIFLPIGISSGILGVNNFFCAEENTPFLKILGHGFEYYFILDICIIFVFTLVCWAIFYLLIHRKH